VARYWLPSACAPSFAEAETVDPPSTGAAFLTGLATNVANPKAGVFAVALLPQFIPDGANTASATAALGLVWATVTVLWYWLYTWLVERGQRLLSTTKARRRMAVASGAALASVGCALAWGL
jgi:threonine/homoserine/homoserine lactone efflux protein